jgi:two-component system, OmpR family, sensor histidine kinase SaeS
MRFWRTLALVVAVAAAGAVGTLVVARAMGMHASDLAHLLSLLLPAALVTVVAAFGARALLRRSSLRQRFVAVALTAAVAALANLAVLTNQMFVADHDATLVTILLVYSVAAGVAAALVLANSSSAAIRRLEATARSLGTGDLGARVGELDAGPELDTLAATLDRMAERLQRAQEREREIETRRHDLITAVSHDLRTPLASLRAMVEAVDEGVVRDPTTLGRYAGEMRRSVNQLVAMVDDLFELTQLDAAAIESETRRASLAEVVGSAVAAVELQAEEKGLSLQTDLHDAADAPCSPRLERVLQNLLANAVRHTPADGSVRIDGVRHPDRLEIAVQDTGEGIGPDDLAQVFDPFFRADQARSGGGSGLGLALAKRIVEALGGRITAASTPEEGSRFAVEIPI